MYSKFIIIFQDLKRSVSSNNSLATEKWVSTSHITFNWFYVNNTSYLFKDIYLEIRVYRHHLFFNPSTNLCIYSTVQKVYYIINTWKKYTEVEKYLFYKQKEFSPIAEETHILRVYMHNIKAYIWYQDSSEERAIISDLGYDQGRIPVSSDIWYEI